jgi:hypothetical protein
MADFLQALAGIGQALQPLAQRDKEMRDQRFMDRLYSANPDFATKYFNAKGAMNEQNEALKQRSALKDFAGQNMDIGERLKKYAEITGDLRPLMEYEQQVAMSNSPEAIMKRQMEQAKLESELKKQAILSGSPIGFNPAQALPTLAPSMGNQPLNVRNNNPLNMRPVGADTGFQQYSTPQEGMDAARKDLAAKISGNSRAMKSRFGEGYAPTLANLITTWAPPSENDTQNYIDFVSKKTGIAPEQKLSLMDIERLIPAMAEMEGGQKSLAAFGLDGQSQQMAQMPVQPMMQPQQPVANMQQPNQAEDLMGKAQLLAQAGFTQEASSLASLAKTMNDLNAKPEPKTEAAKLEQDFRNGLVSKDVYESQKMKLKKEAQKVEQESNEKEKGQEQLDNVLDEMANKLTKLKDMGGIVSEEAGVLSNIGSSLANKDNGYFFGVIPSGQELGRTFGTKEQTIRDELVTMRNVVLRAVKKATGMSAQEMNSNAELQLMLNSVDNPSASYEARINTLKTLSEMYGGGKLQTKIQPNKKSNGWKIEVVE